MQPFIFTPTFHCSENFHSILQQFLFHFILPCSGKDYSLQAIYDCPTVNSPSNPGQLTEKGMLVTFLPSLNNIKHVNAIKTI